LPPQGSDNGRLGNPPCNQPSHFDHQVLQGGLSDGKTTALNSPVATPFARRAALLEKVGLVDHQRRIRVGQSLKRIVAQCISISLAPAKNDLLTSGSRSSVAFARTHPVLRRFGPIGHLGTERHRSLMAGSRVKPFVEISN